MNLSTAMFAKSLNRRSKMNAQNQQSTIMNFAMRAYERQFECAAGVAMYEQLLRVPAKHFAGLTRFFIAADGVPSFVER